ncbi:MAG: AAA family ATPase [Candidatus Peregrinibacteria bacterium]|nr:AAA family ATPase [Candidatus Peregrinibacteria bacterium]
MIKTITIQNFRGIRELKDFELKNLSLLVGENGTSKTSILEAINFCLSPYFISGRIKHTDFYKGEDIEIKIILEFDENFKVFLPDGYTKQEVECNKVCLEIKKRDRATPKKAFSDIVVVSHYVLPSKEKDNENGWEITRGTGSKFKFDERRLSFPLESEGLPKSFYFPKNREKQLQRGFNSSISSVFDDFNWRFNKEVRKIETEENFSGEKFTSQKNNFESSILEKIDEQSQQKTFQTLNEKLEKVGLPKADLSLIDCNAPFDNAFLSQKLECLDLPISQLGSGVEMVVSLLFLETMAEISKENILILIDEPELHLHPDLQNNFIDHIVSISEKNQFLFSTHSPLFVKQTLNNENGKIQIHCLEKENGEVKILELEKRVLPYVSANEVNFIAFGLATEEYHNELYNEIEINFWNDPDNDFKTLKQNGSYDNNDCRQIIFDNEFFSKFKQEQIDSPFRTTQNKVTIHTYIRNRIHHSKENGESPTTQELKQSIEKMRGFL